MIKCIARGNRFNKEFKYHVSLQLSIGIVFCIVVFLVSKNFNSTFSSFIGSMIVVLANFCYGYIAFSKGLVVKPSLALSLHKIAMLTKFVMNLITFACVFILYRQCNYLMLFVAYIVTQCSSWLVLLKK